MISVHSSIFSEDLNKRSSDKFVGSKRSINTILKRFNKENNKLYHSYCEKLNEISWTRITSVVAVGAKDVYTVSCPNAKLDVTVDTEFLTEWGWERLDELCKPNQNYTSQTKRPIKFVKNGVECVLTPVEVFDADTEWRKLSCGLQISDAGNVRSSMGELLPQTNGTYRQVSYFGVVYSVHLLVLEAFHGPKPGPRYVGRHLGANPWDNRASKLAWGTPEDNYDDRVNDRTHRRRLAGLDWADVRYAGEFECVDIAVDGPYDNIVSGNLIVRTLLYSPRVQRVKYTE